MSLTLGYGLIRKKQKTRMNVREVEKREFPRHQKFVRGFVCVVCAGGGLNGGGKVECAHVRQGLPKGEQAGTSQKPHDAFTLPLCHEHHAEQHRIGESFFRSKYKLDMLAAALRLAAASPCPEVREKAKGVTP